MSSTNDTMRLINQARQEYTVQIRALQGKVRVLEKQIKEVMTWINENSRRLPEASTTSSSKASQPKPETTPTPATSSPTSEEPPTSTPESPSSSTSGSSSVPSAKRRQPPKKS